MEADHMKMGGDGSLSRLKLFYNRKIKLPPLSSEEASEFFDLMTVSNLVRTKYIALILVLDILLLALIVFLIPDESSFYSSSLVEYYKINTILCLPLALIVLFTLRPPDAGSVRLRHKVLDNLALCILGLGATAVCLLVGDTTLYFIAITYVSLLYYKKLKEIFLLYCSFFALITIGIYFSDWPVENKAIEFSEILRSTILAIIIVYIRLRAKIIALKNKKLIQNQNEELAKANKILNNLSMQDGLTNIPNRRSFEKHSRLEWKRAKREQSPVGLLMIDIDWFKKYNDRYGHQKGDDCLKKVAKALHEGIHRAGDMVARYGGEEFVAILPKNDLSGSAEFGEKLNRAIANLRIDHEELPWKKVSISIGAASCIPDERTSIDDLINMADEALYDAKEKGRNRVEKYKGKENSD
jgi:diguanylate cyclase (GGDEF)-like protein